MAEDVATGQGPARVTRRRHLVGRTLVLTVLSRLARRRATPVAPPPAATSR